MDGICDVRADVKNYGEDTQSRMQDIAYKFELVLDWCEGVSLTLNNPPLMMLKGTRPNIPILSPNGPNAKMVQPPPNGVEDKDSSALDEGLSTIDDKVNMWELKEDWGPTPLEEEPWPTPNPPPLMSS